MSDQIGSILKSSKPSTNGVNTLSQYSKSQLGKIRSSFTQEILRAKIGSNSSLNYQKVKIDQQKKRIQKPAIQTFHLGGSHWETALVKIKNQKTEVTNFQSGKTKAGQNGNDIFHIIASKIDEKTDFLSFSLALPIQQISSSNGILDGFLKKGKVHHYDFSDLENKLVGLELSKFLKNALGRSIKVSVTNDNTSLAFAAKDLNFQAEIITGVVATGVNFGFFENKDTFINLESGSFDKLEHDLSLADKPMSRLVASGYLYKEFNRISSLHGSKVVLKSNLELEKLAFSKSHKHLKQDYNQIQSLAKTLFERSAQLVAAQIAGIIDLRTGNSNNQKFKLVIEGDLFWKTLEYKQKVEKTLAEFEINLENIEFVKVEFGFITGSAKSVFRVSKIEQKKVLILEKIYTYCGGFNWFSLAPPYKL
jgi:hexokinase